MIYQRALGKERKEKGHNSDRDKPDNRTIVLEQKVFLVETDAQAVPPWPGNPEKKSINEGDISV